MHIAVRELKAHLSHVLSRARAGEVVEVSSRNTPIARIVGIPPVADNPLGQLVADGAVSWRGGKPALSAPVVLPPGGTPVSRIVIEDRG